MDKQLSIAKGLSTQICAIMADSREVLGRFFLAEHAPNHSGEETVLDILNHPDRRFFPLDQEQDAPPLLVNKNQIVALRPTIANAAQWPQQQDGLADCWPGARIEFNGITLEGRVYTGDLKPERRRLTDLLNHSEMFFVFETNESPWIINKEHVVHLEPVPDFSGSSNTPDSAKEGPVVK